MTLFFPGPSFISDRISLLSSRLGVSSRRQMFSLPAVGTHRDGEHPSASPPDSHPVLRKSFRKVVQTVSGFRVRMRTVIVPYVLPPGRDREQSSDDERRELGNEECTAILCVEIENTGEAGPGIGFMIEGADVTIGGDSATTSLIGWEHVAGETAFPLLVGTLEQINLLYAVSFLRSPSDVDRLSLPNTERSQRASMTDLQKAIVINIHGKPFTRQAGVLQGQDEQAIISYPTRTFSSRWNCVLDLSVPVHRESADMDDAFSTEAHDVLPEPASPFPMSNTHIFPLRIIAPEASAEDKPYLLGTPPAGRTFKPATHRRPVTPFLSLPSRLRTQRRLPQRSVSLPTLQPLSLTPAFYTPPSTEPSGRTFEVSMAGSALSDPMMVPPLTPAYPAYSPEASGLSSLPSFAPIPHPQMDLSEGPSMESTEPIHGSLHQGGGGGGGMVAEPDPARAALFQPLVISVRLSGASSLGRVDEVHPLHSFTLDIFVFNKSSATRRLEIRYPEMRRLRSKPSSSAGKTRQWDVPGIFPIDNRVRVG
jgi:hypothetical protein